MLRVLPVSPILPAVIVPLATNVPFVSAPPLIAPIVPLPFKVRVLFSAI